MGKREKRDEIIDKHYDRTSISSGTVNARLNGFHKLLEKLSKEKGLLFVALDYLRIYGPLGWQTLDRVESAAEEAFTDAESAVEFLDRAGFLSELSELRVYPTERSDDTLIRRIAKTLRERPIRSKVVEALEERQPQTTGTALMIGLLAKENRTKELYERLGPHLESLRSVEEERRRRLVRAVEPLVADGGGTAIEDASDQAVAVRDWLRRAYEATRKSEVTRFLEANRLQDLDAESHELIEQVGELVDRQLPDHPDAAAKIVRKAIELVEGAKRAGNWNTSYGDDTFVGHLLSGTLLDRESSLSRISVAVRLWREAGDSAVEVDSSALQEIGSSIRAAIEKRSEAAPSAGDDHTVVIDGSGLPGESWYIIRANAPVEQVTGTLAGHKVTRGPTDTILGTTARGRVGDGADGYQVAGEDFEIRATAPEKVRLYVDGKKREAKAIGPAEGEKGRPADNKDKKAPAEAPRHTVVIDGSDHPGPTWYSIEVSGTIEHVDSSLDGHEVSIQKVDSILGETARGRVVGRADGYRVKGEIRSIRLTEPGHAAVYVDGEQREPKRVLAAQGVAKLRAAQAVRADLRERLGKGPASILLPALGHALRRWDAATVEPLMERARKRVDAEKDSLAAAWLNAARLVYLRKGKSGKTDAKAVRAAAVAYGQRLLSDDALSIPWRCAVAASFLEALEKLPRELLVRAGHLFAKAYEKDRPVEKGQFREFLRQAWRRDLQSEEPVRKAVARVTEAWGGTALRSQSARGGTTVIHYGGSSFGARSGRPWPVPLLMLELSLRLDASSMVRRILSSDRFDVGRKAPAWALLVRHGRHEKARELVKTHWRRVSIRYPGQTKIRRTGRGVEWKPRDALRYDAATHEAAKKFLRSFEEGGHRLIADIALSVMPDPDGGAEADVPKRSERIDALVERFRSTDFSEDGMQSTALAMLLEVDPTMAAELAEPVADAAEELKMAAIVGVGKASVRRRKTILLAGQIRNEIRRGKTATLGKAIDALNNVGEGRQRWQATEVHTILARAAIEGRAEDIDDWSSEEMAKTAVLTRHLLEGASRMTRFRLQSIHELHLLSHVLADETETLAAWRKKREQTAEEGQDALSGRRLLQMARRAIGGKPVAKQVQILARLFGDPVFQAAVSHRSWLLQRLERRGVLEKKPLLDHGADLARAFPRKGKTWAELAEMAENAGRTAEAASHWKKAAEAAPDSDKAARWKLNHAEQLIRSGERQKARKVLNAAEVSKNLRDRWKALIEKAQPASE